MSGVDSARGQEGVTQSLCILHLMPTEHLHDALAVQQIKPKLFGITPLAAPAGTLDALAFAAGPTPTGALWAHRDKSPIDSQPHRPLCTTPCNLSSTCDLRPSFASHALERTAPTKRILSVVQADPSSS